MSSIIRFFAAGVLATLLFTGNVFAQKHTTLEIRGVVQKPRTWTVEDVRKHFAEEIRTVKSTVGRENQERTSTGIPLISLLRNAEPKVNELPKNHIQTFIVLLEAHDGFRAYYTFAELAFDEKENPAMLVWEENGKPIPDNEAPFRMRARASGDRNLYGITRITLIDGARLAESMK